MVTSRGVQSAPIPTPAPLVSFSCQTDFDLLRSYVESQEYQTKVTNCTQSDPREPHKIKVKSIQFPTVIQPDLLPSPRSENQLSISIDEVQVEKDYENENQHNLTFPS